MYAPRPVGKTHDITQQITTGCGERVDAAPSVGPVGEISEQTGPGHACQTAGEGSGSYAEHPGDLIKVMTSQYDSSDDQQGPAIGSMIDPFIPHEARRTSLWRLIVQ